MTQTDYDLLIIGGGLIGASLVCALAGQDLRIALIEAAPFAASAHPSYDDRAKKIARATVKLLRHAGVKIAILGTEETSTGAPARRAGNCRP